MNIVRIHTPPPELAYTEYPGRPPGFDLKENVTPSLNDLNNKFGKIKLNDSKNKIKASFKLDFVSNHTRKHGNQLINKLNNILIVLDINE